MSKETHRLLYDEDKMWEIVEGDHPEFRLLSDTLVEQQRWTTVHEVIVQKKDDYTFYSGWYLRGSTEIQEDSYDVCAGLVEVRLAARTVLIPETIYHDKS